MEIKFVFSIFKRGSNHSIHMQTNFLFQNQCYTFDCSFLSSHLLSMFKKAIFYLVSITTFCLFWLKKTVYMLCTTPKTLNWIVLQGEKKFHKRHMTINDENGAIVLMHIIYLIFAIHHHNWSKKSFWSAPHFLCHNFEEMMCTELGNFSWNSQYFLIVCDRLYRSTTIQKIWDRRKKWTCNTFRWCMLNQANDILICNFSLVISFPFQDQLSIKWYDCNILSLYTCYGTLGLITSLTCIVESDSFPTCIDNTIFERAWYNQGFLIC